MATCNDCVHGELCVSRSDTILFNRTEYRDLDNVEKFCEDFKNEADFVEVKHGYWIDDIQEFYSPAGVKQKYLTGYKCSLCGRTERTKEPYCNCGAKMDGGKSDG